MTRSSIISEIEKKNSFLIIGLDTDISLIPKYLLQLEDPIFEFNKAIISATKHLCIGYKLNTAFYESTGPQGMQSFAKTIELIDKDFLIIADAKRGDIGNTSEQYAKAFFEYYNCNAITVSPYMGSDSIKPYLKYKNKWTIVLGLTSNQGARDFQLLDLDNGQYVYENVLKTVSTWGTEDNTMFVVGATQAVELTNIRKILPDHFLLIPGVGAQGGDLSSVYKFGKNKNIGLLVNISRDIIYASPHEDFAEKAQEQAQKYQTQMLDLLQETVPN